MKVEQFHGRKFNTAKLSYFMIQFSLMMTDLFLKILSQETANESSLKIASKSIISSLFFFPVILVFTSLSPWV